MTRVVVLSLALLLVGLHARAADAPAQPVQLPYIFHDDAGSAWDVQYDGSIGDGGNDLYDGGGRLFLNNAAQYQSPNQQAALDPARNELTFPPAALNGLNVSRKVACFQTLGAIRFTEILENPGTTPVKVQLRCYFNMGGSVQQAIPLVDERKPRQSCGYAIGDQNNAVAMVAAGRAARVAPRFNFRANDDNVDIFYDVEVPPRQTVAVVHFQLRRHAASEAADVWKELREKDLLKDIPRELRRRVVNFPVGDDFIGDLEILRGDALDIVELRGGDAYRGQLKVDRYRLQTLYGLVTLPADKVVCLLNVGTYRPSQLIVTADGDVFAGRLDVEAIRLQLTGGQVTTVPLSQITRLGYRKRIGEPEEWNFEHQAVAQLRGGERVRISRPTADFNLATPSGPIRLNPGVVASITFQGDDVNVPEVHLTDGTRLSALLGASTFETSLAALGPAQRVRLPAAALLKFNFAPEQETDHLTPTIVLANQDQLIGTIGGTLSLETNFDTLHVEGPQIKYLTHAKGGEHDVQITLWDDSVLNGRLVESHVNCLLKCGVGIRVPIAMIDEYAQPLPLPSPPMIERIRRLAHDLDAEEWAARDRAQAQITAIGPSVMSVLRQLQPTAPAEAAQRMELIINDLSKQLERASNPAGAAMGPDGGGNVEGNLGALR